MTAYSWRMSAVTVLLASMESYKNHSAPEAQFSMRCFSVSGATLCPKVPVLFADANGYVLEWCWGRVLFPSAVYFCRIH